MAAVALSLVGLALVAAGTAATAGRSPAHPAARALRLGKPPSYLGVDVAVVAGVLMSSVVVFLAWRILSGRPWRRRRAESRAPERPDMPWWARVLVVGSVFAVLGGFVAAVVVLIEHSRRRRRPPVLGAPAGASHPAAISVSHTGGHPLAVAAVTLAVLAGLALGARAARRRRARAGRLSALLTASQPQETPSAGARPEDERDPRRAIIQAYASFESSLEAARQGRRPYETPEELLARVFSDGDDGAGPARLLTALYERARFATSSLGPAERAQALDALGELRRTQPSMAAHAAAGDAGGEAG